MSASGRFGSLERLIGSGVRAHGVLAGLGALGILAQAPLHLWPFAVLAWGGAFIGLNAAADTARPLRTGALRGLSFGFGHFLPGLYWVGQAFIDRGPEFIPLAPLGVVGLPLLLAAFWGVGGAAFVWAARRGRAGLAVFVVVFSLMEFARGHVFGGLPWHLPGYVWPAGSGIVQAFAVLGPYGVSTLSLLAFVAPAWALGARARTPWVCVAIAFLALGGTELWGRARLANADAAVAPDIALRLVQVDFTQRDKWRPENQIPVLQAYLETSVGAGLDGVTHVIWPEGALPFLVLESADVLALLADRIGCDTRLNLGVTRREVGPDGAVRPFNAAAGLTFADGQAEIEALYDKTHLVPFGEFIPGAGLLEAMGVPSLAQLVGSFERGTSRAPLRFGDAPPVSVQICYEIVFPDFTPAGEVRPGWILNVSNDAWYSTGPGLAQLFHQARLRAIEEGLPVVRSASAGRSAVIDGYGRVRSSLAPGRRAALDAALPVSAPTTVFSRFDHLGFFFILLALVVITVRQGSSIASE
ncbi:MAG: apolipoprotein N-acyltransferase [Maricaulaceae bacterium]